MSRTLPREKTLCQQLERHLRWGRTRYLDLGVQLPTTTGSQLVFQDNGSPILAVAHVDYVMRRPPSFFKRFRSSGLEVWAPQLDDRLGCWMILDLFPAMGIQMDILLTDDEEIGRSTATDFLPDKQYNWICEFDRMGTDVVMYDYDHPDYAQMLFDSGFDVGWGSFTDICYLNHLSVAGFNFGVAYYDQHTERCRAELDQTLMMAHKFQRFYEKYHDVPLPDLAAAERATRKNRWNTKDEYMNLIDDAKMADDYWLCPKCGYVTSVLWDECDGCGYDCQQEPYFNHSLHELSDEEFANAYYEDDLQL